MIDINCDMGEIEELLMDNTYSNLMDHVTSINIACGGHAGDKEMMQKIVQIAKRKKVKIGAHPSYPDRKNFGRYELKIDPQELSDSIAKQINDLIDIADSENITIDHIKPHGALYNKAAKNKELATLICDTVKKINPDLPIMCLAESPMVSVIEKLGMKAKLELLPMQLGDVEESNANIDETVENFNYRPKTSVKEGISNFVDWYLDNQDTLEKNGI